jgi:hypothetical protein
MISAETAGRPGFPQQERDVTANMIDVVHQGPIAIVALMRPPANAMNLELTEEIAIAVLACTA